MSKGPDLRYCDVTNSSCRPSWSSNTHYVNEEHKEIFQRTQDMLGWQAEGDTYKLYEMAHFCGDVILEIGMYAGRSAYVELMGALSQKSTYRKPQYFGVDVDPNALVRTRAVLTQHQLMDYAFLFLGDINQFRQAIDITPTMVFVDGDHSYEGCWNDLSCLTGYLAEGTPVLCHDWTNSENKTGEFGVTRACEEWKEQGYAHFAGVFGCSALYVTTAKGAKATGALTSEHFARLKTQVESQYDQILGSVTLSL